jgi:protein-L-isoaspartate(D-aspartate) O-methyltransferase
MELAFKKHELIKFLISEGALKTPEIIQAFRKVARENFVLPEHKERAYLDIPLPIGYGQTISQPTTVAIMTEALEPREGQKILEIGAGSGWQACLLAEVVGPKGKVYTIERIPELARFAEQNIKKAGYKNVEVIHADGTLGYARKAPFDRIIVTAACPYIPRPLLEQLRINGVLVAPVGEMYAQRMIVLRKIRERRYKSKDLGSFVFVPLVGKYGWKER